MNTAKHPTKSGPGRRHVDGTNRSSMLDKSDRIVGDKLAEKARRKLLGCNHGRPAF